MLRLVDDLDDVGFMPSSPRVLGLPDAPRSEAAIKALVSSGIVVGLALARSGIAYMRDLYPDLTGP